MRCTRVRRELLDSVRFGELGPRSASNLEHLSTCADCSDEVGFDRVLVAQLRRALAARVDPDLPPPRAWYAILAEAQRPEPRVNVLTWSAALVGRLRTATAMAGTGLALLLALNMEAVPVGQPVEQTPTPEVEEITLRQVPRLPTGRTTLVALANLANQNGTGSPARPDPEQALIGADARVTPPPAAAAEPLEDEGPPAIRLVVRPIQTPEHDPGTSLESRSSASEGEDDAAEPLEMEPGAPS